MMENSYNINENQIKLNDNKWKIQIRNILDKINVFLIFCEKID